MKKALFLVLALVLVIGTMAGCGKTGDNSGGSSTPPTNSTPGTSSTTTPGGTSKPAESGLVGKVGDTASYGTYNGKPVEWQALAVDLTAKKALLITKDCVAMMPFLTEGSGNPAETTWENSTIRTWLNSDFYSAAFTDAQKAKILDTAISTPPNSESKAEDTSKTTDKVFFLSEAECRQYFANDEAMNTKYGGEDVAWWTRTPGNDLSGRVCTYSGGGLYMTGNSVVTPDGVGVRPAIWVDITPEQ
ncbi:MAG: DUF6273 domain-containing protein [Oscillospiraceae bacterium]|jgi:hypothetical protein|nr:DUF6273 domain-containing protein [Oscillospiraceae bacterium]